ncbi:MAG: DNA primase [Panacagrimonas sp.]
MAGRIPQDFLHDLLARTDIVEVVGSRIELKRAGREFKACSPFTNEKTPSFYVSPAKQFFHCFSSGKHGNAIGFLMEYDRLSFVEAVEELARQAGVEVPRQAGGPDRLLLDGPLDALAAAQRFFRTQLKAHPPAIDYLKRRGVSGETARGFGIGYAPDAWDAMSRFFEEPAHAISAGLLKQKEETGRVYDVFRHRIMFPIRDARGRVLAFGGRALGDDPAKYLNSPETVVFHKGRQLFGLYEAKQASRADLPYLLVVEGYMDVVMLHQHGITQAVATLGTATTREQLRLCFQSTPLVVFCFDGDAAGERAAWRALEQALPEIDERRQCRFMFLPKGEDPDSFVQREGAEAFRTRIEQAQTLAEFLIENLSSQVQLDQIEGRAQLAGLAKPYLKAIRPGALRSLLIEELSAITRLKPEQLDPEQSAPPITAAPTPPRLPGGGRPVRHAIALLVEKPELAHQVEQLDMLMQADVPGISALVEAIEFFQEYPESRASQLLEHWRGTHQGKALERLLRQDLQLDPERLESEFDDTISHLQSKALRRRVRDLLDQAQSRTLSAAETAEIDQLTRTLSGTSNG